MKRLLLTALCVLSVWLAGVWQMPSAHAMSPDTPAPDGPGDGSVMFIENVGQFAPGAKFRVFGGQDVAWLAEDAVWITHAEAEDAAALESFEHAGKGFHADRDEPRAASNMRLSFVGANPAPRMEPFGRSDTSVSYFIGNDPDQWRPGVPVWGGVRYVDLYPGVDLEVYAERGQWRWRMTASTDEADFSQVRLRVEGATQIRREAASLIATVNTGEVTIPAVENADASRLEASADTVSQVGENVFEVGPFAAVAPAESLASARVVVHPHVNYAGLLGGSEMEVGYEIVVDSSGAAYVTGFVDSPDFPTTPGAPDTVHNVRDAYVAKIDRFGSDYVYVTFVGGTYGEEGYGIAVDAYGVVYVSGSTNSPDFPTTPGAFDTSISGGDDAFVVKLSPNGRRIPYATYIGDYGNEWPYGVAVDDAGAFYVAGTTTSPGFPTTPGAFATTFNLGWFDPEQSYTDTFVTKFVMDGSALAYSTFVGGADYDVAIGLAVDRNREAYVIGRSYSDDFPTTANAFDPSYNGGDTDVVVFNVNATGSALSYSTFLGGEEEDFGYNIVVDDTGAAYVTGYTMSWDFPSTPDSFDPSHNGWWDAFLTKLVPSGSALEFSTFVGGENSEQGLGLALDPSKAVYVSGWASSDFPTTSGAFDTSFADYVDAFVAKLDPSGSTLEYGTYMGAAQYDNALDVAVDTHGAVYVTGETRSRNFPVTLNAFDTSFHGVSDVFVVKMFGPQVGDVFLPGLTR